MLDKKFKKWLKFFDPYLHKFFTSAEKMRDIYNNDNNICLHFTEAKITF